MCRRHRVVVGALLEGERLLRGRRRRWGRRLLGAEGEAVGEVDRQGELAVGVGLELVEGGGPGLDVDAAGLGVEFEQAHPAVAAVGAGLVVGEHFEDGLAGVVDGRLVGFAGEVAVDEHEDLGVFADELLPDLLAGVAVGVADGGGAAGCALDVGVGGEDDGHAGVGVDDGLGPGEGGVGGFEFDVDVEEGVRRRRRAGSGCVGRGRRRRTTSCRRSDWRRSIRRSGWRRRRGESFTS